MTTFLALLTLATLLLAVVTILVRRDRRKRDLDRRVLIRAIAKITVQQDGMTVQQHGVRR